jgi:hypothetical protein
VNKVRFFIFLFFSISSFAQSDLQNVIKGGELLLGGLSIFKIAKSDTKSDSKTIKSLCVKNKLTEKITFRIVGKNECCYKL